MENTNNINNTNPITALVSFVCGNKVYLLIGDDNTIQAFETVRKGLDYFERSYSDAHSRGYESSMSACLNSIQFRPAVHEWRYEDASKLIEMGVIDLHTFKSYNLRNISGSMKGALCTGVNAMEWHESGIVPKLIDN